MKHALKILSKQTLLIVMAVALVFSISGNIIMYSVNSELSSALKDEKWLVVQNIAFSLEALSDLPVPGPLVREEYSNISVVEISSRHIAYHSDYGRKSIQQLTTLDLAHGKNLTQIDKLFVSFEVFGDNLNRLVSENTTSSAIALIDGFSKTVNSLPRDLGLTLQSAYHVRGTVDEKELERALEQTAQTQAILQSMLTESG